MQRTALILLLLSLFACEMVNRDKDTEVDTSSLLNKLRIASGLRVTTFVEDGRDKTAEFRDYRFRFDTNGTVAATRGTEVISGTYRVFRDDGRIELAMNFPLNSALYEFTDDWYFREHTDNTIVFDEEQELLVFQY
jgi:hypothetical protein